MSAPACPPTRAQLLAVLRELRTFPLERTCLAQRRGWLCTLALHHVDDHEAHGDGVCLQAWPQEGTDATR